MSERVHVTSVEAIENFRAQLIVYLNKARAAVEEVSDEIVHTRAWLEGDQRTRWEGECRRFQRLLDEAQQELFSAKISRIRTQTAAQVLAVERAKHTLHHAEDKRDAVKRWTREFGNRAEPLGKEVEQLLTFLTTEMVKAVAYLGSTIKALEAYTAVAPGRVSAASELGREALEPESSTEPTPNQEAP